MPKKPSLNHQMHQRMQDMRCFGESRHLAKADYRANIDPNGHHRTVGIHSYGTYTGYKQTAKEFAKWVKQTHGVKHIEDVRSRHTGEYLKYRHEQGVSAYTYSKDMSALNKIFNHDHSKSELGLPNRSVADITRSRVDREHDTKYNPENYKDQITFAKATGCRRQTIEVIRPEQVRIEGDRAVSVHLVEKGGRERETAILQQYQKEVAKIVESRGSDDRLLSHYTKKIDNHALRSEYSQNRYQELLDGREDAQDYRGYDRAALEQLTLDMGHNRLDVLIDHYLRR